jgi:hypothetical protein
MADKQLSKTDLKELAVIQAKELKTELMKAFKNEIKAAVCCVTERERTDVSHFITKNISIYLIWTNTNFELSRLGVETTIYNDSL